MKYQNIIIGSGPTGTIAAEEILKSGKEVAILDFGNLLEEKNLQIKENFLKDENKLKFLDDINKNQIISQKYKNENLKYPFGSDFVFKKNDFEKFKSDEKIDYLYSNAKGGLSNVWGTMFSPFYPKDLKNWDLNYDDFYKDGREIENSIPLLSSKDNLDKFFPLKFGNEHNYPLSSNAKDFFNILESEKDNLNKDGVFFGRAKMAIGNKYSYQNVDCKSCGLCHKGCPYDCMFNANQLLDQLIKQYNLNYFKNLFVQKIHKDKEEIIIETFDKDTKQKKFFSAKNAFICCGPISTATLLLRSNMIDGDTLTLNESQRFFIPIFKKSNTFGSVDQNKNTLSEIFLEIFNSKLCEKSIHIQYYTFIHEMLQPFSKFFGKFSNYLPKLFPFIFGRLNLLIGYLHSDYSDKIQITKGKKEYEYELKPIKNKETDDKIKKIIVFLKKKLGKNFFVFPFMLNKNMTGASYHYGSSLPMSKSKKKNATSLVGELYDFKNIFILDSSILPEVPASPTTVNVCINSKRIIKEINKLKRL